MSKSAPVEPAADAVEPRNPDPESGHPTPDDSGAQIRGSRSTPRYRPGQKATVTAGAFAGAVGVVATTHLGEVGLSFTDNHDKVDAWFRPSELTRIRSTGLVSDLRGVRGL